MRSQRPAAFSAAIAPDDRSSFRAVVVALVLLFVVSAGPVGAASPEDDSSPAGGAGTTGHLAQGQVVSDAQAHTSELRPQQSAKPFRMNLFRQGDFSSQKTTFWCIPASTQMMMNMMDGGKPNRSRSMQARLYRVGDRLEEDGTFSPDPEPDRWRGMGISEWVGLLNRYEYGPYELEGAKSYRKALRKAARMMRKTGKPVGLVVWHGAHAWVMSGFTATADPAISKDFEVTSVWVQDPWYPRVSSIWGRSRGPNARVSPSVLREDFRRYGRPGRQNPDRDGRFMLVLPRPDRTAAAAA